MKSSRFGNLLVSDSDSDDEGGGTVRTPAPVASASSAPKPDVPVPDEPAPDNSFIVPSKRTLLGRSGGPVQLRDILSQLGPAEDDAGTSDAPVNATDAGDEEPKTDASVDKKDDQLPAAPSKAAVQSASFERPSVGADGDDDDNNNNEDANEERKKRRKKKKRRHSSRHSSNRNAEENGNDVEEEPSKVAENSNAIAAALNSSYAHGKLPVQASESMRERQSAPPVSMRAESAGARRQRRSFSPQVTPPRVIPQVVSGAAPVEHDAHAMRQRLLPPDMMNRNAPPRKEPPSRAPSSSNGPVPPLAPRGGAARPPGEITPRKMIPVKQSAEEAARPPSKPPSRTASRAASSSNIPVAPHTTRGQTVSAHAESRRSTTLTGATDVLPPRNRVQRTRTPDGRDVWILLSARSNSMTGAEVKVGEAEEQTTQFPTGFAPPAADPNAPRDDHDIVPAPLPPPLPLPVDQHVFAVEWKEVLAPPGHLSRRARSNMKHERHPKGVDQGLQVALGATGLNGNDAQGNKGTYLTIHSSTGFNDSESDILSALTEDDEDQSASAPQERQEQIKLTEKCLKEASVAAMLFGIQAEGGVDTRSWETANRISDISTNDVWRALQPVHVWNPQLPSIPDIAALTTAAPTSKRVRASKSKDQPKFQPPTRHQLQLLQRSLENCVCAQRSSFFSVMECQKLLGVQQMCRATARSERSDSMSRDMALAPRNQYSAAGGKDVREAANTIVVNLYGVSKSTLQSFFTLKPLPFAVARQEVGGEAQAVKPRADDTRNQESLLVGIQEIAAYRVGDTIPRRRVQICGTTPRTTLSELLCARLTTELAARQDSGTNVNNRKCLVETVERFAKCVLELAAAQESRALRGDSIVYDLLVFPTLAQNAHPPAGSPIPPAAFVPLTPRRVKLSDAPESFVSLTKVTASTTVKYAVEVRVFLFETPQQEKTNVLGNARVGCDTECTTTIANALEAVAASDHLRTRFDEVASMSEVGEDQLESKTASDSRASKTEIFESLRSALGAALNKWRLDDARDAEENRTTLPTSTPTKRSAHTHSGEACHPVSSIARVPYFSMMSASKRHEAAGILIRCDTAEEFRALYENLLFITAYNVVGARPCAKLSEPPFALSRIPGPFGPDLGSARASTQRAAMDNFSFVEPAWQSVADQLRRFSNSNTGSRESHRQEAAQLADEVRMNFCGGGHPDVVDLYVHATPHNCFSFQHFPTSFDGCSVDAVSAPHVCAEGSTNGEAGDLTDSRQESCLNGYKDRCTEYMLKSTRALVPAEDGAPAPDLCDSHAPEEFSLDQFVFERNINDNPGTAAAAEWRSGSHHVAACAELHRRFQERGAPTAENRKAELTQRKPEAEAEESKTHLLNELRENDSPTYLSDAFGFVCRAVHAPTMRVFDVRVLSRSTVSVLAGGAASVCPDGCAVSSNSSELMRYITSLPFAQRVFAVLEDDCNVYIVQSPLLSGVRRFMSESCARAVLLDSKRFMRGSAAIREEENMRGAVDSGLCQAVSLSDFLAYGKFPSIPATLRVLRSLIVQLVVAVISLHGKGVIAGPNALMPHSLIVEQRRTPAGLSSEETDDSQEAHSVDHTLRVSGTGVSSRAWSWFQQQPGVVDYLSPRYVFGHLATSHAAPLGAAHDARLQGESTPVNQRQQRRTFSANSSRKGPTEMDAKSGKRMTPTGAAGGKQRIIMAPSMTTPDAKPKGPRKQTQKRVFAPMYSSPLAKMETLFNQESPLQNAVPESDTLHAQHGEGGYWGVHDDYWLLLCVVFDIFSLVKERKSTTAGQSGSGNSAALRRSLGEPHKKFFNLLLSRESSASYSEAVILQWVNVLLYEESSNGGGGAPSTALNERLKEYVQFRVKTEIVDTIEELRRGTVDSSMQTSRDRVGLRSDRNGADLLSRASESGAHTATLVGIAESKSVVGESAMGAKVPAAAVRDGASTTAEGEEEDHLLWVNEIESLFSLLVDLSHPDRTVGGPPSDMNVDSADEMVHILSAEGCPIHKSSLRLMTHPFFSGVRWDSVLDGSQATPVPVAQYSFSHAIDWLSAAKRRERDAMAANTTAADDSAPAVVPLVKGQGVSLEKPFASYYDDYFTRLLQRREALESDRASRLELTSSSLPHQPQRPISQLSFLPVSASLEIQRGSSATFSGPNRELHNGANIATHDRSVGLLAALYTPREQHLIRCVEERADKLLTFHGSPSPAPAKNTHKSTPPPSARDTNVFAVVEEDEDSPDARHAISKANGTQTPQRSAGQAGAAQLVSSASPQHAVLATSTATPPKRTPRRFSSLSGRPPGAEVNSSPLDAARFFDPFSIRTPKRNLVTSAGEQPQAKVAVAVDGFANPAAMSEAQARTTNTSTAPQAHLESIQASRTGVTGSKPLRATSPSFLSASSLQKKGAPKRFALDPPMTDTSAHHRQPNAIGADVAVEMSPCERIPRDAHTWSTTAPGGDWKLPHIRSSSSDVSTYTMESRRASRVSGGAAEFATGLPLHDPHSSDGADRDPVDAPVRTHEDSAAVSLRSSLSTTSRLVSIPKWRVPQNGDGEPKAHGAATQRTAAPWNVSNLPLERIPSSVVSAHHTPRNQIPTGFMETPNRMPVMPVDSTPPPPPLPAALQDNSPVALCADGLHTRRAAVASTQQALVSRREAPVSDTILSSETSAPELDFTVQPCATPEASRITPPPATAAARTAENNRPTEVFVASDNDDAGQDTTTVTHIKGADAAGVNGGTVAAAASPPVAAGASTTGKIAVMSIDRTHMPTSDDRPRPKASTSSAPTNAAPPPVLTRMKDDTSAACDIQAKPVQTSAAGQENAKPIPRRTEAKATHTHAIEKATVPVSNAAREAPGGRLQPPASRGKAGKTLALRVKQVGNRQWELVGSSDDDDAKVAEKLPKKSAASAGAKESGRELRETKGPGMTPHVQGTSLEDEDDEVDRGGVEGEGVGYTVSPSPVPPTAAQRHFRSRQKQLQQQMAMQSINAKRQI